MSVEDSGDSNTKAVLAGLKPSILDHFEDDAELSVEDFERVIEEIDPEFLLNVNAISKEDLSLAEIDFDKINLEDEFFAIRAEKEKWRKFSIVTAFLIFILPFLPWLSVKTKKSFRFGWVKARSLFVRFKNYSYFLATNGKDNVLKWLKALWKSYIEWFQRFRYFPLYVQILFFASIFLAGGLSFFVYKVATEGVIKEENEVFLRSFELVANDSFEYDPQKDVEPFFENLLVSSNLLLLPKLVVNLKTSKNSGANPMAALEVFVEGMTPEVTVEIKDREIEMRHLLSRELESFSYDEVESAQGKGQLIESLIKKLNQTLTTGKVRRILIKTIVVKP